MKLKTYLMLLASTGMRATEALALRHKDFDFDEDALRLNLMFYQLETEEKRKKMLD